MNLIKINGELLWCADEVEPGSVVQFTRVGEKGGVPVVELVELMPASYSPQFAAGPGSTGARTRDPQLDGEKWNAIMNDQHQVEGRPLIGRIPSDSTGDARRASRRTAQNVITDPEDIPPMEGDNGEDVEKLMAPPEDWDEAEVEESREVGGLLLLKLNGKNYLVVYDDECRRAGLGRGAKIQFRMMPNRSTSVPGVGRMDVDEIQLGNVLIPAGPEYSGTKNVL